MPRAWEGVFPEPSQETYRILLLILTSGIVFKLRRHVGKNKTGMSRDKDLTRLNEVFINKFMNNKFFRSAAVLAMAVSTVPSGVVLAQDGVDPEDNDSIVTLNDFHVVGHKIQQTKMLPFNVDEKHLPINMTQVDRKMLENRDINDISSATRFLPSVKNRTTYGGFQEFYIRGFSSQLVATDGVADQRSFITSMPMHDLSNVERIELLRGPASALYGQSVVGGVINISRMQPTRENHFRAKLSVGSWHSFTGFAGMSGKLIGPFNYYASVNVGNSDGWRDNFERRFTAYATVSGWFTDKDFIQLIYDFSNDRYGTDTGLPPLVTNDIYNADGSLYLPKFSSLPNLPRKARYNNASDFLNNRTQDVEVRYEHIFSDAFKLRDVAMFRYDNINYLSTEELSYVTSEEPIYPHYYENKGKKVYINLDELTNSYPLAFNHIAYSYHNQLELTGKFNIGSVKNNYVAGYSVNYLHRPSFGGFTLHGPGKSYTFPTYDPYTGGAYWATMGRVSISDRLSQGVYISDVVDVCEQFKFMLAGRYDYYKYRSAVVYLEDGNRDYEKPASDDYKSIVNNAFSYRVGAVYEPVKELSLYTSLGSFFKPNNTVYNDNYIYLDKNGNRYYPENGGEVFAPEKGWQFEVGLKYDWNGLSLNGSYFYIHKDNVVTSLGNVEEDGVSKQIRGQVGRMHSQGFDIDANYTIGDFVIGAGYAYTDPRVGKIAKNDYVQVNADRGNRYTYIPKNQFFITGDYEASAGVMKGFGASVSLTYQDKVYTNLTNGITLDSYLLCDLSLRYRMRNGVGFMATVNNLFNKHYNVSNLGNQMIPGQDINYKLSVTYSF